MRANKILLDTDIGDDIDDAFALALLASFRQPELVAVTTVYRNTTQRAQLVKKFLSLVGAEIPVYAGERLPLSEPIHTFAKDGPGDAAAQNICQWEPAYGSFPVEYGAVEQIVRLAEREGSALTILAIGPLTNLAEAIRRAPKSMSKVGAIVAMGGMFTQETAEWNVVCDPEAAAVVYASGIPFYAVGLDVTLQCTLGPDLLQCFRESKKPENALLTLWLKRWFDYFSFEKSVMHDPLAAACLVEDVCTFRPHYVQVDLTDRRGVLRVRDTPADGYSLLQVAETVDRERFYELVRKRLL